MASDARSFVFKFFADTDAATKGFRGLTGELNGLGRTTGGVGGALKNLIPSFRTMAIAGAAAFGGALVGAKKFIDMGSNLQESISKVNVVFGTSSKLVFEFGKTSAVALGISEQAALEAAGTYGNLLQAFGLTKPMATEMSVSLVALAADLASFNNTSVDDAVLALRSGLSGETEPLKRYGVAINDVRLKQEAMALGLGKFTGTLPIAIKSQAAYSLIMKDSALAQGDFARTSDGVANRQKIVSAQFKDLSAQIGVALIPAYGALLDIVADRVLPALRAFSDGFKDGGLTGGINYFLAALGPAGVKIINWLEKIGEAMVIVSAAGGRFTAFAEGLLHLTGLTGEPRDALERFGRAFQTTTAGLEEFRIKMDGLRASVAATTFTLAQSAAVTLAATVAGNRRTKFLYEQGILVDKAATAEDDWKRSLGGSAKAVETAAEKLKKYASALGGVTAANKGLVRSGRDVLKAQKGLEGANASLASAQAARDQALKGFGVGSPEAIEAQIEFDKAQRGVERAGYAVEESVIAVARAELKLVEVRKDPLSSPADIREAEISLAEAKLTVTDSLVSQRDATIGLNDSQMSLNETTNGAIVGGVIWLQVTKDLADAEDERAEAAQRVTDSIDAQREAVIRLNDALKLQGDLAKLYPKIAASNPLAGIGSIIPSGTVPSVGSGVTGGNQITVEINSLVADASLPQLLVDALQTYNKRVGPLRVQVA